MVFKTEFIPGTEIFGALDAMNTMRLLRGLFGFLSGFGGSGSGHLGLGLDLALDLRGAAFECTDVVEFRAANFTDLENVDLRDLRRREKENSLDAYAVGHLADVEGAGSAATADGDAEAFVSLGSFFLAFFNPDVDFQGITGGELRKLRPLGAFFDEGNLVRETFLAFEETFRGPFTLDDDFRHGECFLKKNEIADT